MKTLTGFLFALVLVVGVVGTANAALIDRGGGLIYDTVLDVTWLQDANYAGTSMTWHDAVAWAEGLEYFDSVRGITWDDWRLPKTLPVNGSSYVFDVPDWTSDGSTDYGYNISAPGSAYPGSTVSELAYMFYNNLGNLGKRDVDGNLQSGYGLRNSGPFFNLGSRTYHSGTEYTNDFWAFNFLFDIGMQGKDTKLYLGNCAWAVRDGDVVPIPSAIWLLGSGLLGLVGFRRKIRKA